MPSLIELLSQHPGEGRVLEIWLRPARDVPAVSVNQVRAVAGRGLDGDRTAARTSRQTGGSRRQVTLFQAEHLAPLAAWLGRPTIDPGVLRRNLVVAGINLLAARSPLRGLDFHLRIGEDVLLEVTGPCDPCSKMERELGPGAYNALRGHGGVTARVLVDGEIRVHDRVRMEVARAR